MALPTKLSGEKGEGLGQSFLSSGGPNSQSRSSAQIDNGIYGTVLYTNELTILNNFLVVREMERGIV